MLLWSPQPPQDGAPFFEIAHPILNQSFGYKNGKSEEKKLFSINFECAQALLSSEILEGKSARKFNM